MAEWGVFGVARSIWDHPILYADNEPLSKGEAWMWLVSAAAWKPMRVGMAGRVTMIERGEFCFAIRFLERKWRWNPGRVERFLKTLEKHDMIRGTSRDGVKVYKISKYNDYQVVGLPDRDKERDDKCDDNAGDVATRPRHDRDTTATKKKHSNIQTFEKTKPDDAGARGIPDFRDKAGRLLARICEIMRISLTDDPERVTWRRQVEEMLLDGIPEADIIRGTEAARTRGIIKLSYVRSVALGPPKPLPTASPPRLSGSDETEERLKRKWAAEEAGNDENGGMGSGFETDEGRLLAAAARGESG